MFAGKIYCPLPSGPHSSLLKTAALHKLFCATRVFRRKFAFMCGAAAVSALLAPSLYDEPAGPSWVGRRGKKNWLRLLLVIGEGVSRALVFAVRESVVGPLPTFGWAKLQASDPQPLMLTTCSCTAGLARMERRVRDERRIMAGAVCFLGKAIGQVCWQGPTQVDCCLLL